MNWLIQKIKTIFQRKYPVVFCFHGGAMRGVAYLGAFDYLYSQGVRPVAFVARSAGCFVPITHGLGLGSKSFRDYITGKGFSYREHSAGIDYPLMDQIKIAAYWGGYIPEKKLSDLRVPTFLAAVNRNTDTLEYLTGNIPVLDAALATCALPIAIGPINVLNSTYYDGEIVGGHDVNFAREMFPNYKILELELGKGKMLQRIEDLGSKLLKLVEGNISCPYPLDGKSDYHLIINDVNGGFFDTTLAESHYQHGYEAAKAAWPEIKSMLEGKENQSTNDQELSPSLG